MSKYVTVKTIEELNIKRIEMEGNYHRVDWDNNRADFYARNGRRMTSIILK